MKLDENYTLDSDKYNWILRRESTREEMVDGEAKTVTSKDNWYYPTLSDALKKYCDQVLKTSLDIADIMVKMAFLNARIDNLIKNKKLKSKQK